MREGSMQRMKIAVFARSLSKKPTGRGFLAQEILRALSKLGFDLHVFAMEPVDIPGCHYWPARGTTFLGSIARMGAGVAHDVRRIHPDVFFATTHLLPFSLPRRIPKVVTLLDVVWRDHPETMSRKNRLVAAFMERALHQADRIACISAFTRDRLAAHWPHLRERSEVVHLACNQRLRDSPDVELGIEGPFVLNVDTFEPRKNLGLFLRAAQRMPKMIFAHCGPIGWNVASDLALAKSLPNVRLLGYVDEPTLASLYRTAAAAVFPSFYEGFHLAPLDAASLGCPVLLSEIPVHREVLGDAASYFPVQDVEALLAGIGKISTRRNELGQAARARAARFRWEDSAKKLAQLFSSICEAR